MTDYEIDEQESKDYVKIAIRNVDTGEEVFAIKRKKGVDLQDVAENLLDGANAPDEDDLADAVDQAFGGDVL